MCMVAIGVICAVQLTPFYGPDAVSYVLATVISSFVIYIHLFTREMIIVSPLDGYVNDAIIMCI